MIILIKKGPVDEHHFLCKIDVRRQGLSLICRQFLNMMETQQQPILDSPAIEQAPMVERVVSGARKVKPKKAKLFWPVVFSYLLSLALGILVAFLINYLFGGPDKEGLFPSYRTLWKIGIPLSLITTFLLGLFLPILFARRKRLRAMLFTVVLLFLTLIVLVVLGLNQISTDTLFAALSNTY